MLETWVQTDKVNTLFVKFNGRNWIEFVKGRIEATYFEISRDKDTHLIILRNDNKNAGEHNFVALNPTAAFQGATQSPLTRFASGTFKNIGNNLRFSTIKAFKD